MKKNTLNNELAQLPTPQLKERLEASRRELFSLRLSVVTAHVKDYSQFKKIRHNIARLLTYIRQQEAANR
jgi:ribosomal protein L29